MRQDEMDTNLLVITAVEGYAQNHKMSESDVYTEFNKYKIIPLIRQQYEALHTQPLEETVNFVEDVMARYTGEAKFNMPHYSFNNQDITIDILMKMEEVTRILTELLKKPFDEVLGMFYASKTFKALKNTESCMWAESSQFIADEFLRESK